MKRGIVVLLAGLTAAGCAAPAVTLYTLGVPAQAGAAIPLGAKPMVIAISRITVPDYLDTQDILVRHGAVLQSSRVGRWASRLSLGATELVTARLSRERPDALVTDQPQSASPSYRIVINVSRFDITDGSRAGEGAATLEADWLIVPNDAAAPVRRDRTRIDVSGPMQGDGEVVGLATAVLERLAAAIDIRGLR